MSVVKENARQTSNIVWRGIGIAVTFHPTRWNSPVDHIEIISDGREPLPITETGYRSNFILAGSIPRDEVEANVLAWLDEEADKESWKRFDAERQQLMLF